jgi:hypothetical protein
VIFGEGGVVREVWHKSWDRIPTATRKFNNNAGTTVATAAHVGDFEESYYENQLSYKITTDSVFYNGYGYDTLTYQTVRTAAGVPTSIIRKRTTYTGCN